MKQSIKNLLLNNKYLSLYITIILFFLLYGIGCTLYSRFSTPQVFLNLFIDNAHLIIMSIGITFVLLIGGIDISVGSVLSLTCMILAELITNQNVNPLLAIIIGLSVGILFGTIQGCLIHFFNLQPFIVTLGGLFVAKGLTSVISEETISITNQFYINISNSQIKIFEGFISPNVIMALIVLLIAIFVAQYTKFGRSIYAVGGNEQSAKLMGINTGLTKISVYAISGFCASLAGVAFSFYMKSGYALHGAGMELDAITSSVIGGTLLTGGVGYVLGTLFGVLIRGTIISIINFQGTLSAWWTSIAVAMLLCIFIILQNALSTKKTSELNFIKKVKGKLKLF